MRHLAILKTQLGKHHPIVQLVTKGLSDDPDQRPEAKDLVCQLELLVKNLVCSHILNELSTCNTSWQCITGFSYRARATY